MELLDNLQALEKKLKWLAQNLTGLSQYKRAEVAEALELCRAAVRLVQAEGDDRCR